jgi:hypothetical protein
MTGRPTRKLPQEIQIRAMGKPLDRRKQDVCYSVAKTKQKVIRRKIARERNKVSGRCMAPNSKAELAYFIERLSF